MPCQFGLCCLSLELLQWFLQGAIRCQFGCWCICMERQRGQDHTSWRSFGIAWWIVMPEYLIGDHHWLWKCMKRYEWVCSRPFSALGWPALLDFVKFVLNQPETDLGHPSRWMLFSWTGFVHCLACWESCCHHLDGGASSAVIPISAIQITRLDWFHCWPNCQSYALIQILMACSSHGVKMLSSCCFLSSSGTAQSLACWYSMRCFESGLSSWTSSWEMTFASSSCMVSFFCRSHICSLNLKLQKFVAVDFGSTSCRSFRWNLLLRFWLTLTFSSLE